MNKQRQILSRLAIILLLLAGCSLSFSPVYAEIGLSTGVTAGSNDFPVAKSNEIMGGYHVAATTTARDAISAARRVEGMLCYVTGDLKTYRLVGGVANTNWQEVSLGASGAYVKIAGDTMSGPLTVNSNFTVDGGSTLLGSYFQLKDFDGDAELGSTPTPVRLISRDGNWMFWNGGVLIGGETNGTAPAIGTNNLAVEGKVGIGTLAPSQVLDVRGRIRNDSRVLNGDYDVWIQGGTSEAQGDPRNLALLGVTGTDQLRVNYISTTGPEYKGGTVIGGPVVIGNTNFPGSLNVVDGNITANNLTANNLTVTESMTLPDGRSLTDSYVKKSGDTMNGVLVLQDTSLNVKMGSDNSNTLISTYGTYSSGSNVRIQPGAELFIGAGESGSSMFGCGLVSGGTENLHLAADGSIHLWTDAQGPVTHEALTITTAGNVGIGTSEPGASLAVSRFGQNNAGGGYGSTIGVSGDYKGISQLTLYTSDANHNAGYNEADSDALWSITAFGKEYTSSTGTTNSINYGDLRFYRTNAEANTFAGEVMRLDGANGFVGVRTSTPTATLEVNGDIKAKNFLGADGTNPYVKKSGDTMSGPLSINSTDNGLLLYDPGNGYYKLAHTGGGLNISFQPAAPVSPSNLLTIKNGGNVGIGTTTPGTVAKLSVAGGPVDIYNNPLRLTSGTDPTAANTFYNLSNEGGLFKLRYVQPAPGSKDVLVANSSGNIGIGTDPTEKLTVAGNLKLQGAGYSYDLIHDGGNLTLRNSYTNLGGSFTADRLTVASDGNIGIGASPLSRLYVSGGTGGTYGQVAFKGTEWHSHFFVGENEDTYIRPGKSAGKVVMDQGKVDIGGALSVGNEDSPFKMKLIEATVNAVGQRIYNLGKNKKVFSLSKVVRTGTDNSNFNWWSDPSAAANAVTLYYIPSDGYIYGTVTGSYAIRAIVIYQD